MQVFAWIWLCTKEHDCWIRWQANFSGFIYLFIYFWGTVFWSDCITLHFHQQLIRVPAAPHSHQHLVLSVFWILPIFIDGLLSLLFILICIPPMTQDMECLFNIFICHLYVFFDEFFGPFFSRIACFLIVDF